MLNNQNAINKTKQKKKKLSESTIQTNFTARITFPPLRVTNIEHHDNVNINISR